MPQILLSAKIGILPTSKDGRFLDANGACLYNYRTYDTSPKKVDAPTFNLTAKVIKLRHVLLRFYSWDEVTPRQSKT